MTHLVLTDSVVQGVLAACIEQACAGFQGASPEGLNRAHATVSALANWLLSKPQPADAVARSAVSAALVAARAGLGEPPEEASAEYGGGGELEAAVMELTAQNHMLIGVELDGLSAWVDGPPFDDWRWKEGPLVDTGLPNEQDQMNTAEKIHWCDGSSDGAAYAAVFCVEQLIAVTRVYKLLGWPGNSYSQLSDCHAELESTLTEVKHPSENFHLVNQVVHKLGRLLFT